MTTPCMAHSLRSSTIPHGGLAETDQLIHSRAKPLKGFEIVCDDLIGQIAYLIEDLDAFKAFARLSKRVNKIALKWMNSRVLIQVCLTHPELYQKQHYNNPVRFNERVVFLSLGAQPSVAVALPQALAENVEIQKCVYIAAKAQGKTKLVQEMLPKLLVSQLNRAFSSRSIFDLANVVINRP